MSSLNRPGIPGQAVFTDDVSLQVFMEYLKKLAVSTLPSCLNPEGHEIHSRHLIPNNKQSYLSDQIMCAFYSEALRRA